MFVFFNPNPNKLFVGDCVIRGISKLTDQDWDNVYIGVSTYGFLMKNMPSGNCVWGRYLSDLGYRWTQLPDTCPDCYTVKDFCIDYPDGKYLLAIGNHVVAIEDGDYYDAWDSGEELPLFYWRKEVDNHGT